VFKVFSGILYRGGAALLFLCLLGSVVSAGSTGETLLPKGSGSAPADRWATFELMTDAGTLQGKFNPMALPNQPFLKLRGENDRVSMMLQESGTDQEPSLILDFGLTGQILATRDETGFRIIMHTITDCDSLGRNEVYLIARAAWESWSEDPAQSLTAMEDAAMQGMMRSLLLLPAALPGLIDECSSIAPLGFRCASSGSQNECEFCCSLKRTVYGGVLVGACAAGTGSVCAAGGPAASIFCGALGGSFCNGIVEIAYHECIGTCRGEAPVEGEGDDCGAGGVCRKLCDDCGENESSGICNDGLVCCEGVPDPEC
jgi:hypothetical protein